MLPRHLQPATSRPADTGWLLVALAIWAVLGIIIVLLVDYPWSWMILLGRTTGFAEALLMTLKISAGAICVAIVIGLAAGLARIGHNPLPRQLATVYIELVRGTPLLVQIYIFYFFLGSALEAHVPMYRELLSWLGMKGAYVSGVLALGVFAGAYVAEIVRSGIESIPRGQWEAAHSLGMSYPATLRHVILPQAVRRILPPLAGQFISLIKDSSLVSVITIKELTLMGQTTVAATYAAFEVWFTVAGLYLVLTLSLSAVVRALEKRVPIR